MRITAEYSTLINLTIKSVLKSYSFVKIPFKLRRKNTRKREWDFAIYSYAIIHCEISLFTVQDTKRRVYRATIHCTLADDIAQMINWNIVLHRRIRASRKSSYVRRAYKKLRNSSQKNSKWRLISTRYRLSMPTMGLRNTRARTQLRITDTNTLRLRIIDTRYALREL